MIDEIKISAEYNYAQLLDRTGPLAKFAISLGLASLGVVVVWLSSNQWVQLLGVAWALLNVLPIVQWAVLGE